MRVWDPQEAAQCIRCQGLMVNDWYALSNYPEKLLTKRCINCGEILDTRIFENRQFPPTLAEDLRDGHRNNHHYSPIPITPIHTSDRAA